MHEVVTKDIMEDLNMDGEDEADEQYQLFAPAGAAILFPNPDIEAWKEKTNRLYLLLTVLWMCRQTWKLEDEYRFSPIHCLWTCHKHPKSAICLY